jgi:hypothetical protein
LQSNGDLADFTAPGATNWRVGRIALHRKKAHCERCAFPILHPMNQKLLMLLLLSAGMFAGCLVMVPGHLYPVQGSLSTQTPVPIYSVSLSGVFKSGTMSATLQDGEVCHGSWAAVRQDDPSAGKMSVEWDSVYGQGFFVANVLGNPVFARAVLTGTKGAILNVELYDPTPGQPTAVKGIAKDDKGNIFKLTF